MIASLAQETKTAIKATLDSETSLQAVCTTQSSGITAVLNTGNIKLPASLEIEGTWTGQCICGEPVAVNMTEMTFKCIYNNGSYSYVTPTYSPLVWSNDEGTQTVTFSYTENDITVTAELSADVIRQPVSLTVTGSWTNEQNVGSVVDTTGLVFTVTYHDDTTKIVEPVVSPETWTESGLQTATFTYTEHGFVVSAEKSVEVYAILVSLSVSGTWANEQTVGSAPDLTGLEFTAFFNDSSSQTIPHSSIVVSPSEWASSGTQTATFSYTYRGVTKTTSKDAKVNKIPAVYQEVEYLESTGTQWINAGVTTNDIDTVECKLAIANLSGGNQYFVGTRNQSATAIGYCLYFTSHNGVNYYPLRWVNDGAGVMPLKNEIFTTKTEFKNGECKFFYNDALRDTNRTYSKLDYASGKDIYISALRNADGVASYISYARYYNVKFSKDDVLVRDFIPCYRKTDNVAGMYDTVSGQFFTNQGTGEFVTGQEV